MADINVLDLTEVTPGSNDDLILFDRDTGEAKSTRYGALKNAVTGDVDSQIQTLSNQKADKSDLTTIVQIGANATQNIVNDTFFYLNGEFVHALQNISNGSAFSLGTNYEKVPIGGLNLISARFAKVSFSGELNSEGYINIGGNVNSSFPIGVISSRHGWAYNYVTGSEVWSLYVYDPVTGQHATGAISGTAYFIKTY